MFLASFADGVVKVFDRRLEEEDAVVRSYPSHSSWVQNVKWHPTLPGHFLSARFVAVIVYWRLRLTAHSSLDGEVKLFDVRGSASAIHSWELYPQGLSAFDVHELTGVFAS